MFDQARMEKAFSDIVHNAIGYAKRMHGTIKGAATDAGRECAIWVNENVHRIDLARVRAMIKEDKTNSIWGGNDEEARLASAIATRQWRHVEQWTVNSEDEVELGKSDSPPLADLDEANVVTSENRYYHDIVSTQGRAAYDHTQIPVLDLDCRHSYVPSTTPGHGHLFLDVSLNDEEFEKLLNVLAECGILDQGYVNAALKRGYSAVRLPWVKKEIPVVDPWADLEGEDHPHHFDFSEGEEQKEELRDGFGGLIST